MSGLMAFIHNISEDDIQKMVKKYKRKRPRGKNKDYRLRAMAINYLITVKCKNANT